MSTNFLTRLTSRTLGAGFTIRPQVSLLGAGSAPDPTALTVWGTEADRMAMPPSSAPTEQETASVPVSGAPTAFRLLVKLPAATPPSNSPGAEPVSAPAVAQRGTWDMASEQPVARPTAAPARQAQSSLHPPGFSPPVELSAPLNRPLNQPDGALSGEPTQRFSRFPAVDPQIGPAVQSEPARGQTQFASLPTSDDAFVNQRSSSVLEQPAGHLPATKSSPVAARLITALVQPALDRAQPTPAPPGVIRPHAVPEPVPAEGASQAWPATGALADTAAIRPQTSLVAEPALPPAAPTIQVTIGRIEVRAIQPPAPAARPRPARPQPVLSLDRYLQQRKGGRS